MASPQHFGRPVRVDSTGTACAMEPLELRAHLSGAAATTSAADGLVHTSGTIPDSTLNVSSQTFVADGDAAAVIGSVALLGEGRRGRFASSVVHAYNSRNHRWTTAHLSKERYRMAAVVVGRLALFAGGTNANGDLFDTVDVYHGDTGGWSTAKLSLPSESLDAVAVGHVALFAGGGTNPRVDLFDAASGRWSTAELSEGARLGMATAAVDDKAIFAGGQIFDAGLTDERASAAVDLYDAKSRRWSTARLAQAREAVVGASVGDVAVFAGGVALTRRGRRVASDVVDLYDARTDRWSHETVPGIGLAIDEVTVGHVALFVGGGQFDTTGGTPGSDVVHVFDAETGRWSVAHLSQARNDVVGVGLAGRWAIFAGGHTGSTPDNGVVPAGALSDAVDVYDAETGRWSTAALGQARDVRTAVSVGDTAIFAWAADGVDDSVDFFTAPAGAGQPTNTLGAWTAAGRWTSGGPRR